MIVGNGWTGGLSSALMFYFARLTMTNKAPKFEIVLSIFSVASYVDIVSYCRMLIMDGMQSESIQLKVVTTSYYTRLVKFL
ncbi:Uncharacterized protein APZ42_029581 [Daphnia magna]|uniref:Uncharacterized protein n=1 Tax=Daphnia magna TaxID=35525 RepID=A0A164PPN3_9CRUS|nr:Uncharacterized protein APZ42_029581 [Daphnia magna]